MPTHKFLLAGLLCFLTFLPAQAARRAVIVVGLTAGEVQSDRLQTAANLAKTGLLTRGFPPADITLLGVPASARAKRDAILAALAPHSSAAPDDETWIILFGTATTRAGQPAFQVSGPRLTAADLATAVAALPGQKNVVIATAGSGGFLPPLLALPDVEAVAATADSGEINEPRFAEFWPQALTQNPEAIFAELAATTAANVERFYEETGLAQGEHARLIDRATGTILEAPFAPELLATTARPGAPLPPAPGFSAADIEIPRPPDDLDIQHLPATDETRALVASAQAAATGSEYAALILRNEADLVIGRDFATRETWSTRSYVITGKALDDLASVRLPSASGAGVSRLTAARVLRPDGSQILVNLPRLASEARDAAKPDTDHNPLNAPAAPPFIELPEVTPGCVIELAYTHERRHPAQIPHYHEEWPLAGRYPVLSARIRLTHPSETHWRTFAPNLPPSETTADDTTRTETWTLADIAAREPLPGDPPALTFAPWIGVSSLPDWDAFANWYQRLAAGSDTIDSKVETLADEIAAAHPDRNGRIRAAYERVAALRYVAIELGVGAFRPRTPAQVWRQRDGDCKDKANLLVAILRRMDIPAEFALVNRFGVTFTEFPGWQFNHALARVPAAPEAGQPHDLWLDSTDRLVPFGIIAPGNLGRQALVFAPGFETAAFQEIAATQEPAATWLETWDIRDDASATLTLNATGAAEVRLRHLLLNAGPTARRFILQNLLQKPDAQVLSVSSHDPYALGEPYRIEAKILLPDGTPPPHPLVPGLAAFFNPPSITRPALWNEGRPLTIIRTVPSGDEAPTGLTLPAGPISPELYATLRKTKLTPTAP